MQTLDVPLADESQTPSAGNFNVRVISAFVCVRWYTLAPSHVHSSHGETRLSRPLSLSSSSLPAFANPFAKAV